MNLEELEDEFEKLEINDPIVARSMAMYQHNECTFEQALKTAIVHLAKRSEEYKQIALERIMSLRASVGNESER